MRAVRRRAPARSLGHIVLAIGDAIAQALLVKGTDAVPHPLARHEERALDPKAKHGMFKHRVVFGLDCHEPLDQPLVGLRRSGAVDW